MIIDNTAALQYLFNDDIYLLKQDMNNLNLAVVDAPAAVDAPPVTVEATVTAEQPVIVAEAPALYFNHVGGNAKQFLILCNYADAEQMDEKHLTALTSALQRKELALADVAILNLSGYSTATFADLTEYYKPTRLLLLGCSLTGWDKLPLNQLQNLDGIKMLYTYSFGEMMGDRDKTKAFWEQMKVL